LEQRLPPDKAHQIGNWDWTGRGRAIPLGGKKNNSLQTHCLFDLIDVKQKNKPPNIFLLAERHLN
jgi:hypothetical protein